MANQRETVAVSEIKVGDEVYFPNSRKPSKVSNTFTDSTGTTIVSERGDVRWTMSPDFEVSRLVEESEDG